MLWPPLGRLLWWRADRWSLADDASQVEASSGVPLSDKGKQSDEICGESSTLSDGDSDLPDDRSDVYDDESDFSSDELSKSSFSDAGDRDQDQLSPRDDVPSNRRQPARQDSGSSQPAKVADIGSSSVSSSPTKSKQKAQSGSSTSWSEAQRQRRDAGASQATVAGPADRSDDITRSVKSILNKLTVRKFDELCTKLMECGFCTQAHVEMLVRAIITEAQVCRDQQGVYADLCARVIAEFGDAEYLIKRVLRMECRQRFDVFIHEAQETLEAPPPTADEAAVEAHLGRKLRMMGHVRFMGQLVVRSILQSQELFLSIVHLLQRPLCPDSLEALAALLSVVGPKLDRDGWPQRAKLNVAFGQMEDLLTDPELPRRVKYLLRDVLDLRRANWVDTRQATPTQPPSRQEQARREPEVCEWRRSAADWRGNNMVGMARSTYTAASAYHAAGAAAHMPYFGEPQQARVPQAEEQKEPRRQRRRGGVRERHRRRY